MMKSDFVTPRFMRQTHHDHQTMKTPHSSHTDHWKWAR